MGFQTEYEYERLPTTADEAERAPSECKRKRCRGRIFVRLAGLALVLFGVHHYFGHPSLFSSSSFGHTGCQRLAGPRAEFQAFKEITKDIAWFDDKDYDRGTPVKCYGPSDDGGNFDVPTIKLDGDDVYFFDVPKRKHDLNNPRWQTGGTFTLKVSDKVHKVTVDATITPGEIAFAQVCEFVRESGARGVGVVVPDSAPTDTFENKIDFTVKVPPGATLAIDKLETVFYNYTQDIHDISENAAFNSVNLVNILGYIHSKGITVDGAANITSVNGNVTGSYSATDALGIVAVHGFVGVDIDLIASSSAPANLTISGVGLGVEAYVSLCAAEGDFDPSFNVAASAVASALNVEFVDAPVGSKLTAAASAVTGRANVTLHPTFEGTFEASTVGLTKEIVLRSREGEKDPTGEGRKRTLESHTVGVPFGRGLAGRVYWGNELPENAGSVKLSSLLGSAALTF